MTRTSHGTDTASGHTPVRSQLLIGGVRHRRHRPRLHTFRYRVWHLLLDVDELDRLDREIAGLTVDRPGPIAVRRTDHFGADDLPLRTKVERWVRGQGRTLPGGRLLLVAYPRVLGHVFNPVSWWYAYHEDGRLGLVIAEVRNTFGDWRAYLLDDLRRDGHTVRAAVAKDFHVSPFLPVDDLTYRFALRPPSVDGADDTRIVEHIDVFDGQGGRLLDATQSQTPVALTGRTLAAAAVRTPLVTLRTVWLIHWQALRLFWRRTPFHRRPDPPPAGLDALARSDDPQEVSA